MIDLIIWANTKAAMRDFGIARGLTGPDGEPKQFVDFCWWSGDGKFRLSGSTAAGFVALLHIQTAEDEISEGAEQWQRSQIAKAIKNNGTPGTLNGTGIPYYEWDGVRLFRPADVETFLTANNLSGHEWCGGNSY